MAGELGPFPGYKKNASHMLRVIRNHRTAAHGQATGYEGLQVTPVPLDHDTLARLGGSSAVMSERARAIWDEALNLGKMYGTKPGFYLLAGPSWKGETPKGITRVFQASANTAFVVPRVVQDDIPADNIAGIDMYPLSQFDGTMKTRDWRILPSLKPPTGDSGQQETRGAIRRRFDSP